MLEIRTTLPSVSFSPLPLLWLSLATPSGITSSHIFLTLSLLLLTLLPLPSPLHRFIISLLFVFVSSSFVWFYCAALLVEAGLQCHLVALGGLL